MDGIFKDWLGGEVWGTQENTFAASVADRYRKAKDANHEIAGLSTGGFVVSPHTLHLERSGFHVDGLISSSMALYPFGVAQGVVPFAVGASCWASIRSPSLLVDTSPTPSTAALMVLRAGCDQPTVEQ